MKKAAEVPPLNWKLSGCASVLKDFPLLAKFYGCQLEPVVTDVGKAKQKTGTWFVIMRPAEYGRRERGWRADSNNRHDKAAIDQLPTDGAAHKGMLCLEQLM